MPESARTAAFLLLAAALVAGCSREGPAPEPPAQAGTPGPSKASADEECFEIFLPKDAGLANEADLQEGIKAELKFRKEGDALPVALRMEKSKFLPKRKDGVAFIRHMEMKKEEIRELGPGEEPEPKDPSFFNQAMGPGLEGLDRLLARIAEEMAGAKMDCGADISADLDVPVGLVMEGYRRAGALKGVLYVGFVGMVNPLDGSAKPPPAVEPKLAVRVDERLLRDPADGCPAMVVAVSGFDLDACIPAPPAGKADADPENHLAAVSALMRGVAGISRPENDRRLSNAWLVIRSPADAPCMWLWAFMQEAVQPGIGIWKIRVLLPRNHAFRAKD